MYNLMDLFCLRNNRTQLLCRNSGIYEVVLKIFGDNCTGCCYHIVTDRDSRTDDTLFGQLFADDRPYDLPAIYDGLQAVLTGSLLQTVSKVVNVFLFNRIG